MHGHRPIPLQALLSYASLFEGLEADALARIARGSTEVRLFQDDVLFAAGSRCEGFHLIIYGQVKVYSAPAQGGEKVVDILGPDQTFGETLMFAGQPHMFSARALSDGLALYIPKAVFFQEFEADPELRLKLLSRMSMRLHDLMAEGHSSAQQSGTQRFIAYLLRQLPEVAPEGRDVVINLPTSKGNISSLLNLTKEHFSRILRALSERGLIAVKGCRIMVPDMARLIGYQEGAKAA